MCRDNYQMDRKAGQTPVKTDPTVRTPVEAPIILFPNPQKFSTNEEKVCAKAPQFAINPVCAMIESAVESSVGGFFNLGFCRPCEFSFLNIDNSKRSESRDKTRRPTWSKSDFFWGRGRGGVYLRCVWTNEYRLENADLFYTPCATPEHLWCCAEVFSQVSKNLLPHLKPLSRVFTKSGLLISSIEPHSSRRSWCETLSCLVSNLSSLQNLTSEGLVVIVGPDVCICWIYMHIMGWHHEWASRNLFSLAMNEKFERH